MKTLLTLFVLFLSSISFNSYGGWFDKTICVETDVQIRGDIIYLPNETKPFTGKNLCNYENGQIKSQGKFKDGIKDDEWTFWYENGQINSEINFKQGIKFNETIYVYNKNGQLRSEENYKEGILIGESINSYYENGQIEWKENYKDNKLDGKVTFWSENGEIEHEATFKKSKCTSGECNLVACFKNFNILDDKIISLPNETEPFTGINLCKYENGQIEIQIKIKDGMLDGKYKQWNENGQIVLDANFKDNTVHGNYTEWWSNGQVRTEGNLNNGEPEGKYTAWYKNGQLMLENHYKNGKLDGKATEWSEENGQKTFEGIYEDGEIISILVNPNE